MKSSFLAPLRDRYYPFTFHYDDTEYGALKGLTFQVIVVGDDPEHLPFLSEADGEQAGKKIERNVIYARRGSSTQRASYDQIQRMVNRRIETTHSSRPELELERHLSELKLLYGKITPYLIEGGLFQSLTALVEMTRAGSGAKRIPNPVYPGEGYEQFVARMIEAKKKRVETFLSVNDFADREGKIIESDNGAQ